MRWVVVGLVVCLGVPELPSSRSDEVIPQASTGPKLSFGGVDMHEPGLLTNVRDPCHVQDPPENAALTHKVPRPASSHD